jgi:hypothetical protein
MKISQITRDEGRPKKPIRETIKKDLGINELDRDMIYDRTLWRSLIHVANNPTFWDKAWLLLLLLNYTIDISFNIADPT